MWIFPMAVYAADPYLQSASSTAISISWNDSQEVKSTVEYGTTSALGFTTTATALPSVMSAGDKVWHTVRLTGLIPNTTYFYKCVTGTVESTIFNFRTFPADNAKTGHFRVCVYGDNRSNATAHLNVMTAVKETVENSYGKDIHNQLNLVINAGDILNSGGNLNGYTREYFTPISALSKSAPFMVSIGNHEGNNPYFYKYMDYESCDTPTGADNEKYFSFRAGPILFIIVNSAGYTTQNQLDWIETKLQGAEADETIDWVMGFCHHPGHSEVWPAGNTSWVQNSVIPLLAAYPKVCGLYYGHSHNYEIGAHLESPLRLILSGGGGGPLDRWRGYANQTDYPEIYKSFDHYGYTILDFDLSDRSYTGDTYSIGHPDKVLDNVKLDSFRQSRSKVVPPTKPTAATPAFGYPVKLVASAYAAGSETIMSSQFQVTKTPGNYTAPVINTQRDWINYYYDTGAPDYTLIDKNEGINLERLSVENGLDPNVAVAWRVRYRDQNLLWSEWSDEVIFTPQWNKATQPSPATDSIVSSNVDLSWTAALSAVSHNVYLGTHSDLGAGDLRTKQTGTSYTVQELATNTTYYWRVDEVNAEGTTTGIVWRFNVAPNLASGYVFTAKSGVKLNSIAPGKAGWVDGKTNLANDTSYKIYTNMDNQGAYWEVKLGFTFNYCGQTFTHVNPRSDGYVALSNGSYSKPGTDYPGQISNPAFKNALALLWDDQRLSCAVQRTGTAGNYIMTIEMYGVRWNESSRAATVANVAQLKIYEATGVIEMIYDIQARKTGRNVTHIGISDNGLSYLSVNPTAPASASSTSTHNIGTNIGLGEGAGSNSDVIFTFDPQWPPTANEDDFKLVEGTITANVMRNDLYLVVQDTTAHLVSGPTYNRTSFTLSKNGSFTYTNTRVGKLKNLSDSFTYELRSGDGVIYNTVTVNLFQKVYDVKWDGGDAGNSLTKVANWEGHALPKIFNSLNLGTEIALIDGAKPDPTNDKIWIASGDNAYGGLILVNGAAVVTTSEIVIGCHPNGGGLSAGTTGAVGRISIGAGCSLTTNAIWHSLEEKNDFNIDFVGAKGTFTCAVSNGGYRRGWYSWANKFSETPGVGTGGRGWTSLTWEQLWDRGYITRNGKRVGTFLENFTVSANGDTLTAEPTPILP